jgi:ribosome-associated toxin RatA of RatAB toxin-antitoxin module
MHTENIVIMRGSLDRIVDLASDVERWPEFLPHYRWVTLLAGGGDRKVVEMAATRDGWPLKWRAVQTIDRTTDPPVIRYDHIWGPTRGMAVGWEFDPRPDGVHVRIWHTLDLQWPLIGGTALGSVIADRIIGPEFVGNVAGKTLETIKQIVERESGATS